MNRVLQFITNGSTPVEVITQVKEVLEGGCGWIQLRLKEFTDDQIIEVITHVKPMCEAHGATLIMNDRVDMAANYNLDGVHLGIDDMPVSEARNILGDDAIIGVTANTIEEILTLCQQPMSYFGIGPMRFTTTKKNLRPEIGLSGYHDIVEAMRQTGVNKPAVAIGGITIEDVFDLLALGLWGVAVSGTIARAPHPKEITKEFMSIVNKFNS